MAEAIADGNLAELNAALDQLEADGLITRQRRANRTFEVALVVTGKAQALLELQREILHPKGHYKACLLLLIGEKPAHGYELTEALKSIGYGQESRGRTYRALRSLEEAGLVESAWKISSGPARRVFTLTSEGSHMLELIVPPWRARNQALRRQLDNLAALHPPTAEPTRSFQVVLEAKLCVAAADIASATRLVESAFGKDRPLSAGVRATGQLRVYASSASSEDESSGR